MKKHQKPCIKTKDVIDRRKRIKTLNNVKPVENVNKNPYSFLETVFSVNCKFMHMVKRTLSH